MTDIVSKATRSRMMSGIRGENTKPEIRIRQLLHRDGFRFRLHGRDLPGRPDIVLPRYRAVVFVHGCFWHGHQENCHLFKLPGTRRAFWTAKIVGNRRHDKEALAALVARGWRVATIWECALKGRTRLLETTVAAHLAVWLRGDAPLLTIEGQRTSPDKTSGKTL
ncbi:MAG: very short patch repair endonuclease [Opitutaceae bacterium]|jgi:DNA mismatch endonuclease (patch repair protein)|nr:very short patch repair endonuclease [Opitutaceae bacterium]